MSKKKIIGVFYAGLCLVVLVSGFLVSLPHASAYVAGDIQDTPDGYALVGVGYGSDDHGCWLYIREGELTATGIVDKGWRTKRCNWGGGDDGVSAAYVPANNYLTGWSWDAYTSGGTGWSSFNDEAPYGDQACYFQAYRKIDADTHKLTGPIMGWGWGSPSDGTCEERNYSGGYDLKITNWVSDISDSGACGPDAVGNYTQCAAPMVSKTIGTDTARVITGIKLSLAEDGSAFQPVPVHYRRLPLPTVSINAYDTSVPLNGNTTVYWSSSAAGSCSPITANSVSTGWTVIPNVDGSHATPNLTVPTIYRIFCTGMGGTASQSVTVSIDKPDVPISASPTPIDVCASPTITCGGDPTVCGKSVISWGPITNVVSAANCTLSGSWSGTLSSSNFPSGSLSLTGVTSTRTYTMTCTGPGGTTPRSATVGINAPGVDLGANPGSVNLYGTSVINWDITNVPSLSTCALGGAWGCTPPCTYYPVSCSGVSSTAQLSAPTTYSIQNCIGPGGMQIPNPASVKVDINDPVIPMSANPSYLHLSELASGSVISWGRDAVGSTDPNDDIRNVTSTANCTRSGDWSGALPAFHGTYATGPLSSSRSVYTYYISCKGAGQNGDSTENHATVSIYSPTASISASSSRVDYNTTSTITWSSTDTISCSVTGPGINRTELAGQGVTPNIIATPTTYTITCTGATGTNPATASTQVTIHLPTASISASPNPVNYNTPTTLTWSSAHRAFSCSITGTDGTNWPSLPVSGTSSTGNLTANQTYTVTCVNPIGSGTQSVLVTVSALVCPGSGTIYVSSTNSVTGGYVTSSWTFPAPPRTNPCSVTPYCTYRQYASYPNMPADPDSAPSNCIYTINPTAGSAGLLYTLKKIDANFIAKEESNFFGFDLLGGLFIKLAKAFNVLPAPSQGLSSGLGNILFNIQWYPKARINVSPTVLNLTDANPNGSVAIANDGGDGSELGWSASTAYSTGFSGWLTVLPLSSGVSGPILKGSLPQTVAVKYKSGSLPNGTVTSATLTFSGTTDNITLADGSHPWAVNNPQSVTVNISVSLLPVTVTPNPPPALSAGIPAAFTVGGGMGATYNISVTGPQPVSVPPVSGAGSTFYVTFPWLGTYTLTVTDPDPADLSPNNTTSTTVTVAAPPASCTFSASPPNPVPLTATTLNWSCQNVDPTSCTITPGIGPVACSGGPPCTGSQLVNLTSTASYTLYCNGVYGGTATKVLLPINVRVPKIREVPP